MECFSYNKYETTVAPLLLVILRQVCVNDTASSGTELNEFSQVDRRHHQHQPNARHKVILLTKGTYNVRSCVFYTSINTYLTRISARHKIQQNECALLKMCLRMESERLGYGLGSPVFNPGRGKKIFYSLKRPGTFWGPPSFLLNDYLCSFGGGGGEVNH
jgi:hypothetical protein